MTVFRLVFIAVLSALSPIASADVVRLSEPVASDARSETFGAPLPSASGVLPLADLLEDPARHLDQPIVIEATVGKVCQKKGCFFVAQDGAAATRVSFKDYAFFVPSDIAGRRVTLAGVLTLKTRSAAQAEHLNKDLREAGAFRAGEVFEFVATAVRVPKH